MPPLHDRDDSFVPHYIRIRNELLRRIEAGQLAVGDQLPSVRAICREFGVSTITARRAQLDLIKDGVADQRRGVGLFVRNSRRRERIALILTGFSEDGWRRNSGMVGQLVGGISSVAWQRGAVLSVIPIDQADTAPEILEGLLDDQPVDGVLLRSAGDVDPALVAMLGKRRVPVVSVKRQLPGVDLPCALSDDRGGAFQAADHLLGLGHRRIGFIVQQSSREAARLLELGFRQAHDKWGVPVDEELVARTSLPLTEAGHAAAVRLLGRPDRPTAISVGSDLLALGVYDAAAGLGLAIPDDLAVVGFDDQDVASRLRPPLSSVHLSYYDLGEAAVQLLFDLLDGASPPSPIVVDVALAPRESTLGPTRGVAAPGHAEGRRERHAGAP
jgi:LacI family transcriptional regulator